MAGLSHPLNYAATGDVWTCPITGVEVCKTLLDNVAQRLRMRERCEGDEEAQAQVLEACRRSPLVWINLFGMTFRQHETLPDGTTRPVDEADVPMVTWPAQDTAISALVHAIRNGEDLLIDKSRDQGATWVCLFVFAWFFVFTPNFQCKVISRKEDEVDTSERRVDMNTLMWKLRYILDWLPAWMRPEVTSSTLYLHNEDNSSTVKGESTNDDVARGGRLQALLLDECSAYDNLDAIERASHRAASSRIYNSTPKGPGKYSDLRFSGRVRVVVLGFWDHPEQGLNRRLTTEDGKLRWTSPWREDQKKHYDRRTIAQNIDIDHEQAGAMFFDSTVLAFHHATYAVHGHTARGRLVSRLSGADLDEALRREKPEAVAFRPDQPGEEPGELRLWTPLCGPAWCPTDAVGVPVLGIDVAMGTGASHSAICVFDRETGGQVAEWVSSTTDPAQLARVACMLGLWLARRPAPPARVRGIRQKPPRAPLPLIAWETNGGGGMIFSRVIQSLGWPYLYRDVVRNQAARTATDRVGWTNNRQTNLDQLGWIRTALSRGECVIRSPETIAELGRYVFFKNGNVGPAGLENEKADAHATHGDRARAAAVAWDACVQAERLTPPRERIRDGSAMDRILRTDPTASEADGLPTEHDEERLGPAW